MRARRPRSQWIPAKRGNDGRQCAVYFPDTGFRRYDGFAGGPPGERRGRYPKAWKSSEALWPPKPNELLSAVLTGPGLDSFGV